MDRWYTEQSGTIELPTWEDFDQFSLQVINNVDELEKNVSVAFDCAA